MCVTSALHHWGQLDDHEWCFETASVCVFWTGESGDDGHHGHVLLHSTARDWVYRSGDTGSPLVERPDGEDPLNICSHQNICYYHFLCYYYSYECVCLCVRVCTCCQFVTAGVLTIILDKYCSVKIVSPIKKKKKTQEIYCSPKFTLLLYCFFFCVCLLTFFSHFFQEKTINLKVTTSLKMTKDFL